MPWSSTQWTEERTERLKKLWERGFSAGLIARDMQTTRNAVIGKIQRLGLDWRPETQLSLGNRGSRAKPSITTEEGGDATARTTPPLHHDAPPLVAPPTGGLHLLDLKPRQCRWPHGEGPFKFCGATVLGDFSYCEQHARAAYPNMRVGK